MNNSKDWLLAWSMRASARACVSVCDCGESVCVHACVRVYVYECVCMCARACLAVHMSVRIYIPGFIRVCGRPFL